MTRSSLILAAALLTTTACSDSSGGDREAVSMQLALTASTPPAEAAPGALGGTDAQGNALMIENAVAHVRHIELDLPADRSCAELSGFDFQPPVRCDGDGADDDADSSADKIVIEGPFVVDLVAGTAQPSLDALTLPAGTYERVDVRFDHAEDATETLGDDTLVADGRYNASAQALAFELRLRFNEDARFETERGVEVGGDTGNEILLWLDVSEWFSALPITQCIEDGDLTIEQGTLRIDEDSSDCSDIENELKNAIKNSADLD